MLPLIRHITVVLEDAVREMGSQNTKKDVLTLFKSISGYLLDSIWESFEPLFGLSSDEEGQVRSVISRVSAFDAKTFARYKKRIDASLEKTKEIRARLQSSSIENVDGYLQKLSALEEELKIASLKKAHTEEILLIKQSDLCKKESEVRGLKKAFEDYLKASSVSAISGKTLLLLEELQSTLYSNLIQQVEQDLNKKFNKSRMCICWNTAQIREHIFARTSTSRCNYGIQIKDIEKSSRNI